MDLGQSFLWQMARSQPWCAQPSPAALVCWLLHSCSCCLLQEEPSIGNVQPSGHEARLREGRCGDSSSPPGLLPLRLSPPPKTCTSGKPLGRNQGADGPPMLLPHKTLGS